MVGIDEVGRGALAGPLLVVAAEPTTSILPPGLRDSKLLSRIQRQSMLELLLANFNFGEGWVSAAELDKAGLGPSLRLGVQRALAQLGCSPVAEVILDGSVNYIPPEFKNGRCEIGADARQPIVSAASIYAKVKRDNFMIELAGHHPNFSFDKHVGYATAQHRQELADNGPLELVHRLSFAPLRQMVLV